MLLQYSSWGVFAQVFDEVDDRYSDPRAELRDLLTEDEYKHLRTTILTAFYAPPEIVGAMWDGLATAGFTDGEVL